MLLHCLSNPSAYTMDDSHDVHGFSTVADVDAALDRGRSVKA
jgi:hypothetical protein